MANSSTSPAAQMAMPPQIGHLQLHFVLIPLMSPGHLLPMVDMAKLLAQHGVTVTILTTPLNTVRFKSTIDRAVDSGLQIRLLQLQFPATEAGLPEGCENMDSLPSRATIKNFFDACKMLQQPFEELFAKLHPPPSCIISGKNLAWTVETARKFGVPRIFFDGMSCFSFSCTHNLEISNAHGAAASKFEPFLVPNLPHQIQLTRAQLPESLNPGSPDLTEVRDKMRAAENEADGILVNTFEELEAEYVKMYRKIKGGKVWCIGPVTSCNKLSLDKAERGEKASKYAQNQIRDWLDSFEPNSVVYACLGSICGLTAPQLIELGLGLEASNHPFIWAMRSSGGEKSQELEKWMIEEVFEERIKGRGLVIRGWAPQLLILSHKATGAFLTHCGWNSTVEGVSAGVPIIACPLFAEQFINERLVVDVLEIGVSVGVEAAVTWGMEEKFKGVVMKRMDVKRAVEKAMEKGEEGKVRRERAKEIGVMARRAVEEGGSSYLNMEMLIQYVFQQTIVLKLSVMGQ
ncbi:UDP-glycosyltransferase 73C3-like [Diospyros lotus]|uniref:UDP-glycosyltransferase 73C3-like n=1 Tax=Diospyros lotus TaxID=55363 RepID=UPI00224D43C7|nr:UDP-glycosyltransferase 73C3-like [Diospyros lotus]